MNPHRLLLALSEAERQRVDRIRELARSRPPALPELLAMLTDGSWAVRRELVQSLGAIGEPAVAPLCEVVRHQRDDETRLAAAVDALVASSADVLPALDALATDENPAAVADAAQVLGHRRARAALPLLARLVRHADDNVAVAAIEALGKVGGRGAIDTLIDAARSRSFFRVFPAIDVLGRSGDPRVVEPLAELLADPVYAGEATRALGRTGELTALRPLASLLASPSDARVRGAAAALAELHARHLQRYGDSESFQESLSRLAPRPAATRRLAHAATDAEPPEQAAIALLLGVLGGPGASSALRALLDGPRVAADAAAAALKKLGRDTEAEVRAALRDGDSTRREVLLPMVARLSAAPEVLSCLGDASPSVRALACEALARIGAASAVPALFPLLADENPRVVQAAVGAIQSLGTEEATRLAMQAARGESAAVRRAALRILGYFGVNAAIGIFLEAVDDADARVAEAAIAGLPFLDDPRALDALLEVGARKSERMRAAAMRALGQTPRKDPRVVARLLRGMHDPAAWVRYFACQALGRLGAERAVEPIVALLDDPAGQVRVAAVEALAQLGGSAALTALRRAAAGEEPDVRRAALIGLGLAQDPASAAVLRRAAQASDPATRLVAVSAIADGSPHAVPVLSQAARDRDSGVRAAAIGFLAAAPGSEATAVLVDLLRDSDDPERIVTALVVPTEGRASGLVHALETADDELAPWLASALVRIRTPESLAALLEALVAAAPPGRKAAATALASVGSSDVMEALRRSGENDPDPQVRQVCAALLAR